MGITHTLTEERETEVEYTSFALKNSTNFKWNAELENKSKWTIEGGTQERPGEFELLW